MRTKNIMISSLLKLIIGGVFFFTGVSKVFVFNSFVYNINKLSFIPLPYWTTTVIALIVISLEILAGLFLIIGVRTKESYSILAVLVILFTMVISYNYFVGREATICSCFGILPIKLDVKLHLIFNFILLLAILFSDTAYLNKIYNIKKYSRLTILLNALLVIIVLLIPNPKQDNNINKINQLKISTLSSSYFAGYTNVYSKKMILFVDFADFGCTSCSNNITYFCNILRKKFDNNNILILINKRKSNDSYYSWMIKNWRKDNNIVFPIKVDKNRIFEFGGINKSSVAIFDIDRKLITYEEFPMSANIMDDVLNNFGN